LNDLFAKHRHSTELIKQYWYGRNRKAAEAALTFGHKNASKQTNQQVPVVGTSQRHEQANWYYVRQNNKTTT